MKTLKIAIIFLLLFLTTKSVLSQEFKIPNNLKLTTAEDYHKYEDNVLQGIKWLEKTKINEQIPKRMQTKAFLMKWITGTPTFSIAMQAFQINLTKKNPELLMSFLGGWTKYAIENPSDKDNIIARNMAGIESILKVYNLNKGNGIKKDKKIERLLKLNKTRLENWIKKQLE